MKTVSSCIATSFLILTYIHVKKVRKRNRIRYKKKLVTFLQEDILNYLILLRFRNKGTIISYLFFFFVHIMTPANFYWNRGLGGKYSKIRFMDIQYWFCSCCSRLNIFVQRNVCTCGIQNRFIDIHQMDYGYLKIKMHTLIKVVIITNLGQRQKSA